MTTVKTVYEIVIITIVGGVRNENKERIAVAGFGQKAANAVDKKYKGGPFEGRIFKKFFKGFQINDSFVPVEWPTPFSHNKNYRHV